MEPKSDRMDRAQATSLFALKDRGFSLVLGAAGVVALICATVVLVRQF